MTIRLGTNPIAWSNDDMRTLGGSTALATCLSEARLAGYSGIELGHKFPREAGPLGELLGEHQLALVSGWYSSALLERSPTDEIAAIDDHAGLLSALGCEVLVLAETSQAVHGRREVPLSASPSLSSDEIRSLARDITEVAKHLTERGLRLAYHHHLGTVIETGDEIDAFMDAAGPEVALLLDTGHAYAAGVDPVALASTYADRIAHVHCKDVRLEILEMVQASEVSFLDGVVAGMFTVPGDGCIDFNAALGPVARTGYAGWLVVEAEQDPEKANPLTYARAGYDYLSAVAETVGFSLQGER